MKKNKIKYIIALLFFIAAIGVVWMGINEISKSGKIKEDFTKTEAIIVDCVDDTWSDDDGTYVSYDVYVEYTADLEVYKYRYESKSSIAIGSKMVLYYNPDNPKEMYLDRELGAQFGKGLLYFVLAVIVGVIGVAVIIGGKKKS